MDNKKNIESKILKYYMENCKHKGLIFISSEKRNNNDSEVNFYDVTFKYDDIELQVAFAADDEEHDIRDRFRQVLRENNIYL